ncbi:MAG: rRNA pseudouridine synthase [Hyphomonas sp.]|nr:rRNA pseudouridine synthase [Hyphomonas sp.]
MAWTRTYEGAEPLRINKWLAEEGVCSRREADALIERGLVKVDGVAVTPGQKIEQGQMLTLLQKATRQLDNKLTVILNKPVGYVSGTPEPGEIPAVRIISKETLSGKAHAIPGRYNKLAPLGRLDKDSRGLLILSEDGVLAKALIGPESTVDKEYMVKVKGDVTADKLALLRHGLELDGRKLKPADVEQVKAQELRIVLREGRNRQIRRMCQLVELRVVDLVRVRIGAVELAGLPEGKWRPLGGREREALLAGEAPQPRAPRPPRTEKPEEKQPPRRDGKRPAGPRAGGSSKPGPRASGGKPPARSGGPKSPEKRVDPTKGAKFKRTKLGPRKRSPVK